ncbi:hypothetical protein BH11GEM2_BH11GEM2_26350 [soil metagenome]
MSTTTLPALTGSDKQVVWAEQIRAVLLPQWRLLAGVLAQVVDRADEADARGASNRADELLYAACDAAPSVFPGILTAAGYSVDLVARALRADRETLVAEYADLLAAAETETAASAWINFQQRPFDESRRDQVDESWDSPTDRLERRRREVQARARAARA